MNMQREDTLELVGQVGSDADASQEETKEAPQSSGDLNFTVNGILKALNKHRKHRRWGRKEDREMFSQLKSILLQLGIDADEFYQEPFEYKATRTDIFSRLLARSNWKNDIESLVHRVHTLTSIQEFSTRDMKLLKRLVKRQKVDQKLDYDVLAFNFPGKTETCIKQAIRLHLTSKNKRYFAIML